MRTLRLMVLTVLLLGLAVLMARSVARALRTGTLRSQRCRHVPPVRCSFMLLDLDDTDRRGAWSLRWSVGVHDVPAAGVSMRTAWGHRIPLFWVRSNNRWRGP